MVMLFLKNCKILTKIILCFNNFYSQNQYNLKILFNVIFFELYNLNINYLGATNHNYFNFYLQQSFLKRIMTDEQKNINY